MNQNDHGMIDSTNELAAIESRIQKLAEFIKTDSSIAESFANPQFGKYRINRILASRGQVVVANAYDPDLHRQVVLKIEKHDREDDVAERITHEGKALSQISSPYIAQCLSVEVINGHQTLVLEYIPGNNLIEHFESGPVVEADLLRIGNEIALGLQSVHQRGMLHLDIKPENVMIDDCGRAKLIDFGLARPICDIQFGRISGTPAYMPPEVANHELERIGRASDIFGVGAILYFLATGQPPYSAATRSGRYEKASRGDVDWKKLNDSSVSQATNNLIKDCLLSETTRRIADTDILLTRFSRIRKSPMAYLGLVTIVSVLAIFIFGSIIWSGFPFGATASNTVAGNSSHSTASNLKPVLEYVVDHVQSAEEAPFYQTGGHIEAWAFAEYSEGIRSVVADSNKTQRTPREIPEAEIVLEVKLAPKAQCVLFSLQFESSHYVIEGNQPTTVDDAQLLSAETVDDGNLHRFEFDSQPSCGCEYFLLVASETPFDGHVLEHFLDSKLAHSRGVVPKVSGDHPVSIALIPYKVIPKK